MLKQQSSPHCYALSSHLLFFFYSFLHLSLLSPCYPFCLSLSLYSFLMHQVNTHNILTKENNKYLKKDICLYLFLPRIPKPVYFLSKSYVLCEIFILYFQLSFFSLIIFYKKKKWAKHLWTKHTKKEEIW